MKKHFLLIGFSCTRKTSLCRSIFEGSEVEVIDSEVEVIDSDDAMLEWIKRTRQKKYNHIYEIYMDLGRKQAISLIEQAEEALIVKWADDKTPKVISLGPGFPIRKNWPLLRAVSNVVLLRRSPQGIYDGLKDRREDTFEKCPDAKGHDNWDVGVMVDKNGTEYDRQEAINKIAELLAEREQYYKDRDEEVYTDDFNQAKNQLQAFLKRLPHNDST